MSQSWVERKRPERLEARYEFDSYQELRDFLDQAAELSESKGLYPDMGFGNDYVNMTIHADEDGALKTRHREFAELLEQLNEKFSQDRE
ncbi:MAG: 4a-hydroxytetrahydrobiopterin dehydratase [Gammaproteobacteria bacterium]|nr:4a-hydroxytetrahydrobiopterin dehydratase [Gammaproteobacteria bacterium]